MVIWWEWHRNIAFDTEAIKKHFNASKRYSKYIIFFEEE